MPGPWHAAFRSSVERITVVISASLSCSCGLCGLSRVFG